MEALEDFIVGKPAIPFGRLLTFADGLCKFIKMTQIALEKILSG